MVESVVPGSMRPISLERASRSWHCWAQWAGSHRRGLLSSSAAGPAGSALRRIATASRCGRRCTGSEGCRTVPLGVAPARRPRQHVGVTAAPPCASTRGQSSSEARPSGSSTKLRLRCIDDTTASTASPRAAGPGDSGSAGGSWSPPAPVPSSSSLPMGSAASDVEIDQALDDRGIPCPGAPPASPTPDDDDGVAGSGTAAAAASARSRAAMTAELTWTALAGPDCSCHSAALQPWPKRCSRGWRGGRRVRVGRGTGGTPQR